MESVIINDQEWAPKNLNIRFFRNGDPIPQAQSFEEWEEAAENKTAAWCYYNNNELNGDIYGVLYNWYAVSDPRGLAPVGWKIPVLEDWERLTKHLGDGHAIKLRSDEMWISDDLMSRFFRLNNTEENTEENTVHMLNSTGFDAQPCGARGRFGNAFYALGDSAYWWTNTEDSEEEAHFILLYYHNDFLQTGVSTDKKAGHAVRCIKEII